LWRRAARSSVHRDGGTYVGADLRSFVRGGCLCGLRREDDSHLLFDGWVSRAATAASRARAATKSTPDSRGRTTAMPSTRSRRCDANIQAGNTTTTCAFALNTFYEFYLHDQQRVVEVWSPAARRFFLTRCAGGPIVACRASDGGRVRFPLVAVKSYSAGLAAAFAASRDIGPSSSGASSPATSRKPASSPAEASPTLPTSSSGSGSVSHVCYPGFARPAVSLPAVTLSATTLPAFNLGGTHYPAQHFSAQHIQAIHIPAVHVGQTCIDAPRAFALSRTSLLPTAGYTTIDAGYSPQLTQRYWQSAGASVDIPDPTGSGFGDTNAAGFPKNQYVRPSLPR
jgi:hypothetical protein